MKCYLITGGAGFIGSNFINYILSIYNDIFIINLDILNYSSNISFINKSLINNNNYIFIKGDIDDKNLLYNLFSSYKIDYIVNFAAQTHVDNSIKDSNEFINTNIKGFHTLISTALEFFNKGYPLLKFLQISTDEVYGSSNSIHYLYSENSLINPSNPYSASKASTDLIAKSFFLTYKFPINISRSSNNYGPNQFYEKFIPKIINNVIKNKKIPIYGDGMNIRDWIFVTDNCKALDLIINNAEIGKIYNISSNFFKSNIELVKYIINIMKLKFNIDVDNSIIQFIEDRPGHDFVYPISYKNINHDLGWKPETDFKTGIINTINFYIKNKK